MNTDRCSSENSMFLHDKGEVKDTGQVGFLCMSILAASLWRPSRILKDVALPWQRLPE